jgi:hypothetical protein
LKIYSDDTNLPYRTSKKTALDSKRDIDGILARWGITKVMWDWDLDNNNVEVNFQINEKFQDRTISPIIRLKPPTIWKKRGHKYNRTEEIDWKLSMRIFHWWIKNQLAMTYALKSSKTLAFLPHVVVDEESTVKDVIVPRLEELKHMKALPKVIHNG